MRSKHYSKGGGVSSMFAVVTPEKIELPAGSVVRLLGSWQEYRALSQQRSRSLNRAHQESIWRDSVNGSLLGARGA